MVKSSNNSRGRNRARRYVRALSIAFFAMVSTYAILFILSNLYDAIVQGPLFSWVSDDVKVFFKDYAEGVGLVVAVVFFIYDIHRDNKHEENLEFQQKRTARYWVFYNAMNRINQDVKVLVNIRDILSVIAGGGIEDQELVKRRFRQLGEILQGFKIAWENDDILSEQLAFEFSLLSTIEKRCTLIYFGKYNALEDYVALALPTFWDDVIRNDDAEARVRRALLSNTADRIEKKLCESIVIAEFLMRVLENGNQADGSPDDGFAPQFGRVKIKAEAVGLTFLGSDEFDEYLETSGENLPEHPNIVPSDEPYNPDEDRLFPA